MTVVGGYTKFMKLKPRGINNIFTATVNAFVVGAQNLQNVWKKWVAEVLSLFHRRSWLEFITDKATEKGEKPKFCKPAYEFLEWRKKQKIRKAVAD